jgi:Holliday junction resolvase RusA-like endonuclease
VKIQFFVAGVPKTMSVGKSVRMPRKGGGTMQFQERRGTEWASLVGDQGQKQRPPVPLQGAIALSLLFLMPRPKSASKKVQLPLTRPDIDNLFHKLTDQWNGVMWVDDSQITDLSVSKRFVGTAGYANPGLEVTIIGTGSDEEDW